MPPAAPAFVSLAAPPDPARRPHRASSVVGLLVGASVGAAAGYGGMTVGRLLRGLHPVPRVATPIVIVGLIAVLFLVILAHELGHLAAGRLAGTRAHMLVVGPLMLVRGPGGGWAMRLNRAPGMAGGLALTTPHGPMAGDVEWVRRAMRLVVIGGPAASVLFALLAAGLALAAAAPAPSPARAAWVMLCGAAAICSAGIGLVCLLPMRAGGLDTDGRQALDLRPGSPAAHRKAARAAVVSLDLAGVRPRDWPAPLVATLTRDLAPKEATANVVASLLAASHAFDAGRPAEGRAHVAEALAGREALPKALRGGVLHEGAWVAARVDGDAAGARALLAEAAAAGRGLNLAPYQQPMAEAALAWLEGHAAAARRGLDAARAALAAAPALTGGSALLVRDRLDALAAEVDAGAELPAGPSRA